MSKFSVSRIKVVLQPDVLEDLEVIVRADRINAFKVWFSGC